MRRLAIPLRPEAEDEDKRFPFDVYFSEEMHDDYVPLYFQQSWLLRFRGVSLPEDVMECFSKLKKISRNENVPFEELVVRGFDFKKTEKSKKNRERKDYSPSNPPTVIPLIKPETIVDAEIETEDMKPKGKKPQQSKPYYAPEFRDIRMEPKYMLGDVRSLMAKILPNDSFCRSECHDLATAFGLFLLQIDEKEKSFSELYRSINKDVETMCYNISVLLDTVGGKIHPVGFQLLKAFFETDKDKQILVASYLKWLLEPYRNDGAEGEKSQ